MADEKVGAKPRGVPFKQGNPGKPRGARNRTTRAVYEMLEGERNRLTRKAIDLGLEGNITALRLCLDRLAPPSNDMPLSITLPPIRSAGEALDASLAVLAAMASGQITPAEAGRAVAVLASHAKIVDIADHEQRIEKMEAKLAEEKCRR